MAPHVRVRGQDRVPVGALQNWEQGHCSPQGLAQVLLALLERHPRIVQETLTDERDQPEVCAYRPKMPLKNWAILLCFFLRSTSAWLLTQAICTTRRSPENGRWPCQELSERRKANMVPMVGGTSSL